MNDNGRYPVYTAWQCNHVRLTANQFVQDPLLYLAVLELKAKHITLHDIVHVLSVALNVYERRNPNCR